MKNILFVITAILFFSCGNTKQKSTAQEENTPSTSIMPIFEAYKSKQIDKGDTIEIATQTDDFIAFSHYPTEGEIIGITYIQLRFLGNDKLLYFMYACVEGTCNLDASNIHVFTKNWEDVTSDYVNMGEITQIMEQARQGLGEEAGLFDSFFAKIDEKNEHIDLFLMNEEKFVEKGEENNPLLKKIGSLVWDDKNQKFNVNQ